jgi:hypothetical protein
MEIVIVPDTMGTCPRCGAYWGNPNKALDFPNRQKVDEWWKCYNPTCVVGYFVPGTNRIELKPSPEEMVEIEARAAARVAKMRFGPTRYFSGGKEVTKEVYDSGTEARYLQIDCSTEGKG